MPVQHDVDAIINGAAPSARFQFETTTSSAFGHSQEIASTRTRKVPARLPYYKAK